MVATLTITLVSVVRSPPQGTSNAYANGANQNCGNVMTGRSTTRLHAPPGGKSSFSIGMQGAPSDVTGKIGQQSNIPAQRRQAKPVQQMTGKIGQQQFQQQASQPKSVVPGARGTSANRYANGANQNCGNVITDRPTSRVLKPPGGGSSGPLW